jgi:hypothetical protein
MVHIITRDGQLLVLLSPIFDSLIGRGPRSTSDTDSPIVSRIRQFNIPIVR